MRLVYAACRLCFLVAAFFVCVFLRPLHAAEMKRVVLLKTMSVPVVEEQSRLFIEEMKQLGYIDGKSMALTVLQAEGSRERARTLLKKAIAAHTPDLVVTSATMASQEAKKILQGSGIPQLFFTVSDPVGAGLIRAEGVPTGTNITGVVHTISRDVKLAMVMDIFGKRKKKLLIGVVHSSYPSSVGDIEKLQALVAKRKDVQFVARQFPYLPMPAGKDAMFQTAARMIRELDQDVDCWWHLAGPLGETPEFVGVFRKNSNKPVVFGINRLSVESGALFHLTTSSGGTARLAMSMAVRILQGEKAGTLPVRPTDEIGAGINLTTALAHGLTVPSALFELAGDNIFR